jgi:hypothetical protein
MAEMILIFNWDGTITKKTKGFVGSECVSKTKFMEDALGTTVGERKKTAEYYETEKSSESQRIENRGNSNF